MTTGVHIYIFTKDNATALACLLSDLHELRTRLGLGTTVTLIDDSVEATGQSDVSRLAEAIPAVVLRAPEQQLLHRRGLLVPPWLRRPLGTKGYDVATCRNTAFAHVLSTARRAPWPLLFLDSDIRLKGCHVGDTQYDVQGETAIAEMLSAVAADPMTIAGTPLVGRADFSLLDHLDWQTRDSHAIRRVLPALVAHSLPPVMTTRATPGLGQPLGMSGGVMCLAETALREAPMGNTYNEDILWLAHLRHKGFRLLPTTTPLIHADPRLLPLLPSMLQRQAPGEALWLAVEEHGWGGLVGRGSREAWQNALYAVSEAIRAIADRITNAVAPLALSTSDGARLRRLTEHFIEDAEGISEIQPEGDNDIALHLKAEVAPWRRAWRYRPRSRAPVGIDERCRLGLS